MHRCHHHERMTAPQRVASGQLVGLLTGQRGTVASPAYDSETGGIRVHWGYSDGRAIVSVHDLAELLLDVPA